MKKVAIIPARYESKRFIGKPLALILGKPMIQHVYESVLNSKLFDKVAVATDDQRILNIVESFQGECVMTSKSHESGTDRVFEVVNQMSLEDNDIVINVQGDEPLISNNELEKILSGFSSEKVEVVTLKTILKNIEEVLKPDNVKVVTDKKNNALYFSRSIIPNNFSEKKIKYYKHIGIYAYRFKSLKKIVNFDRTFLEISENLEQLRFLENGIKIKVLEIKTDLIGVDRSQDIQEIEKILKDKMGN